MRSALPMYIYGLYSSLLYFKLAYITISITIHYTAGNCGKIFSQMCQKINRQLIIGFFLYIKLSPYLELFKIQNGNSLLNKKVK
jgi:hypothetical protein